MTKILVIDDDIAINELIKVNLELQGYETTQAFNGIEGFAKAKQEIPALIILDVMMPEVDGFTVAQRIRQCPEIAETPLQERCSPRSRTHRRPRKAPSGKWNMNRRPSRA